MVQQFDKWIALDPTYDCWFSRHGTPLSGLEVHEALVRGDAGSVMVSRGGGKGGLAATATDDQIISKFYYLAADMRTDHLSRPLHFWNRGQTYLAWDDPAAKERPFIYEQVSSRREDFDFALNQVRVQLRASRKPGRLWCYLQTNMPGVTALMIKQDDGPWTRQPVPFSKGRARSALGSALSPVCGQVITWHWKLKPGGNKLSIRGVNLAGVTGPVEFFQVAYHPRLEQDQK